MRVLAGLVASGVFWCAVAHANDTSAELRTGGLTFVTSDVVAMEREDLYVSRGEIRVDYVFRNISDARVETVVAFPMPELTGNPYSPSPIAFDQDDNFLDFSVRVDGAPVTPDLEQRAFANGVDVTEELTARGVPLMPNGRAAYAALATLPPDLLTEWQDRGIVLLEEYDDGTGMMVHAGASWTLRSSFFWTMAFPPGGTVRVGHRYTPAAGGMPAIGFLTYDGLPNEEFAQYEEEYCIDDAFRRAAIAANQRMLDGEIWIGQSRLGYVLTTGANWAGPIGEFHLTVDKGKEDNLVSFCGDGVRKTGPTTFELTYTDFTPRRDLAVLLLETFPQEDLQ